MPGFSFFVWLSGLEFFQVSPSWLGFCWEFSNFFIGFLVAVVDIEMYVSVHVESRLQVVPVILIWQNFFQVLCFTFTPPLFKNSLPGGVGVVFV